MWKEGSGDGNGLAVCGKRRDLTTAKDLHVGAKNRTGRIVNILPPFQNVGRFGFFRFVVFAMHLDIIYV